MATNTNRRATSGKQPTRRVARSVKPIGRINSRAAKLATQMVMPLGNGWVVKAGHAKVFTAISDTKKEAVAIARNLAKTQHHLLIVYGKNGLIQVRESYVK